MEIKINSDSGSLPLADLYSENYWRMFSKRRKSVSVGNTLGKWVYLKNECENSNLKGNLRIKVALKMFLLGWHHDETA